MQLKDVSRIEMQLGEYIKNRNGEWPRVLRGIALGTLVLIHLQPSYVCAASMKKLMGIPAFTGLVTTIARLNKAMRDAAENPQDDFRRKNVRTAFAALPPAIFALAGVFNQGQLGQNDWPAIQNMLGSFVDVNAADNYTKFMQKPSADLIPQVGSSLPAGLMQVPNDNSGARLAYDDNAAKTSVQNTGANAPGPQQNSGISAPGGSGDSAGSADSGVGAPSVSRAPASIADRPIASSASGIEESGQPRFDDSSAASAGNAVQAPDKPLSPIGLVRDNGSIGQSMLVDARSDLVQIEEQQGKTPSSSKRKQEDPGSDRVRSKPKYWKFGKILQQAEALLIQEAHAAQDDEEGGGGGGGKIGGILMGIGAIMAAIVPPIVVAGDQMMADITIATMQAATQAYMTNRTAQNSEALGAMQQQTAMGQANVAAATAQTNNQGVTERLQLQLAQMQTARQDQMQMQSQQMQMEQTYNNQRIALTEQQVAANQQLARLKISNQLQQQDMFYGAGGGAGSTANELSVQGNPGVNGFVQPNMANPGGTGGGGGGGGAMTGLVMGGGMGPAGLMGGQPSFIGGVGAGAPMNASLGGPMAVGLQANGNPAIATNGVQRLLASASVARGLLATPGVGGGGSSSGGSSGHSSGGNSGVAAGKTLTGKSTSARALAATPNGLTDSKDGLLLKALRSPARAFINGSNRATAQRQSDISSFIVARQPATEGRARGVEAVVSAPAVGGGHQLR